MASAAVQNINGQVVVSNWAEASAGAPEAKTLQTLTAVVEENGKQYKVTTSYNVTTKQVPRAVAERKKWKKFGAAEGDADGPNVSTTFAAEPTQLNFIQGQLEQELADDKKANLLGGGAGGEASTGRCRLCKKDGHWSHSCPYKDVYAAQEDKVNEVAPRGGLPPATTTPGAYVPPSLRDRGPVGTAFMGERRNDESTCRVTNLPEDMPDLEEQLRDMFGQIGRIERFYLARDKTTNRLRGFAFITYESRVYAERAINQFNNAKFGHLILKVEWTKPSNN